MDCPDADLGIDGVYTTTTTSSPIRTEYERVVPYILDLCRDFGLDPQAEQNLNLATLMRSLECLDRHYDAISDEKKATKFVQDVFLFLRSQDGVLRGIRPIELPEELIQHLIVLREVLHQTLSMGYFIDLTGDITKLSREAREITHVREYIRSSLAQGQLTGELVLKVLDFNDTPATFSPFMTQIAAAGNLYDDYRDAEADYKDGRMIMKPGFVFKTALRIALTERAAWIAAHHPNKPRALQIMKKFHF